MAGSLITSVPLWGQLLSFAILVWAVTLGIRLHSLWRWTTEVERWRNVQRKHRAAARRQLGLT